MIPARFSSMTRTRQFSASCFPLSLFLPWLGSLLPPLPLSLTTHGMPGACFAGGDGSTPSSPPSRDTRKQNPTSQAPLVGHASFCIVASCRHLSSLSVSFMISIVLFPMPVSSMLRCRNPVPIRPIVLLHAVCVACMLSRSRVR